MRKKMLINANIRKHKHIRMLLYTTNISFYTQLGIMLTLADILALAKELRIAYQSTAALIPAILNYIICCY